MTRILRLHNSAIAVTLALFLGGCTSTRLEDAVPQQPEPAIARPAQTPQSGGALPQITPQERARIQSQIDSAQAQQQRGRARVELTGEELKAIARGHADEALEEIEAEE